MNATLRSEFRKLLTVRSTYVVSALALVMIAIFSFWVEGYKGLSGSAAALVNNKALQETVINAGSTVAVFSEITAVLFVVHEYRHNLIMYTLTASNSRTKVLAAKVITIAAWTTAFTLFASVFAIGCYMIGIALRDASLPPQDWNVLSSFGRVLFYNVAFTSIGLMIGFLTRNIAGALVMVFVAPNTIEPLLGLLLKNNAVYLPFAAMERIITTSASQSLTPGSLSPTRAMLVTSIYLLVGWAVTWTLFQRRDAN